MLLQIQFFIETCVFAYLGMALFTFPLVFKPAFICWCIVSLLLISNMHFFNTIFSGIVPLGESCKYFSVGSSPEPFSRTQNYASNAVSDVV